MDTNSLGYFKKKLLKQRKDVEALLSEMRKNETIDSNRSMDNELSNYDNHPADAAGDLYEKERGLAFKGHEISMIKKIDEALASIENGTYGKCRVCGNDILRDRLEFVPYAQCCTRCQEDLGKNIPEGDKNRPVEEKVLGNPFGYGYNDFTDKVGFDAEDSYQSVGRFNNMYRVSEYYDYDGEIDEAGFVEPIERISNEEYKNQLPD